jgi:hypothetical protein
VYFLDKLDHLPVGDEIPLRVGRFGKEAAGDRQLAPIGARCLLGDPGAVNPPLGNQTDCRLDFRAGAITESLEPTANDLELLFWIDLAHRHTILSLAESYAARKLALHLPLRLAFRDRFELPADDLCAVFQPLVKEVGGFTDELDRRR